MMFADIYDLLMSDIDYQELLDFLKTKIDKNKMILDAGCGSGNILIPLLEEGYRIIGIDNDAKMLSITKIKAKELNLNAILYEHDLIDEMKISVDVILLLFDVLNYFQNPREVLSNVYKSLNRNGLLILDIYKFEYLEEIDGYSEEENMPVKYKFTINVDGNKLTNKVYFSDDVFVVDEYVYELKYYKKLLKEIGFTKIDVYNLFDERKHYLICQK